MYALGSFRCPRRAHRTASEDRGIGHGDAPADGRGAHHQPAPAPIIQIYTLDGTLVRTLQKSSDASSLTWDLTDAAGQPLASSLYLLHVRAQDASDTTRGTAVHRFALIKRRVQAM